jgi:hypothetical protein
VYVDDEREDVVLAYFRRPREFSRTLRSFPWQLDEDVVLFTRDSREPAYVARLVSVHYNVNVELATGYMILRLLDVNEIADGVTTDARRVGIVLQR